MPVISMFYGIIVSMYFVDNRQHKAPHIHVRIKGMKPSIHSRRGIAGRFRSPGQGAAGTSMDRNSPR